VYRVFLVVFVAQLVLPERLPVQFFLEFRQCIRFSQVQAREMLRMGLRGDADRLLAASDGDGVRAAARRLLRKLNA
jgi:hypothetical protein